MALTGNNDETNGYNSVIKTDAKPNANLVKSIIPPIGTVVPWHKTFGSADSGTTDATTTDKLVDSDQNFRTTVKVGMIVYNSTDSTFSHITVVDADGTLSLNADIMTTGEAYTIYKTPYLPDGWIECTWGVSPLNGSGVLSDSDSPMNGQVIPNLNTDIETAQGGAFIRGASASTVAIQTDQNAAHTHVIREISAKSEYYHTHNVDIYYSNSTYTTGTETPTGGDEARPNNMWTVMIMRIK